MGRVWCLGFRICVGFGVFGCFFSGTGFSVLGFGSCFLFGFRNFRARVSNVFEFLRSPLGCVAAHRVVVAPARVPPKP